MKLHELRPPKGANKKRIRAARGTAGRRGKTAGRGTKGQNARTGGGVRPYFEGGQLPLVRRMPVKRGFTNVFRVDYTEVNLDCLKGFRKNAEVNPDTLAAAGIIKSTRKPVVILGRGELDKPLRVSAHRFSASAREKIEAAGGTVNVLEWPKVRRLTKSA
ncbi:MAG: 50S ribosomal protein L15 [Chloroflexi bacterium]|nr:50S ribosomal protein L15 [Chloroflexota bacterium]